MKFSAKILSSSAFLIFLSLPAALGQVPAVSEHLKACDSDEFCQSFQNVFKDEYESAFKKRYTSQRNVAYMLEDRESHPNHGVQRNWIAACAWRALILNSRSREVDDSDRYNLEFACRRLNAPGRVAAAIQADELIRKIYKRSLPASFRWPQA